MNAENDKKAKRTVEHAYEDAMSSIARKLGFESVNYVLLFKNWWSLCAYTKDGMQVFLREDGMPHDMFAVDCTGLTGTDKHLKVFESLDAAAQRCSLYFSVKKGSVVFLEKGQSLMQAAVDIDIECFERKRAREDDCQGDA